MKKIIILIVVIVFVVSLSACGDGTNTTEINVKHVSATDILKITENMSYKQTMSLLGKTAYTDGACGWFLYSVDDMQYLQVFSSEDDSIGQSGAEILERIKINNTETHLNLYQ